MGKTRVTSFSFRCSLIVACDQDKYPRLKVSQLLSEVVDMLLFLLCGLTPATRTQDLACATKRKARLSVRRQHEVRVSRGRSRFDAIADNYGNVPELAMRDGYPWHQCSDEMKVKLRGLGEGRAEHGEPMAEPSTLERKPLPSIEHRIADAPLSPAPRAPRALMNAAAASPQAALTPGPRIEEIRSPGPQGTTALAHAGAQVSDPPGQAESPAVTVGNEVKLVLPQLRLPVLPSQLLESSSAKRRRVGELQAAAASGDGAGASPSPALTIADVD